MRLHRQIGTLVRSRPGRVRSACAAVLLAMASGSTLGAQRPRTSAPIADVRYEITADSAAVRRRHLGVVMTFRASSTAPVVLALPAWSPGHYTLLWFSRRVSGFSAESNGGKLDWRMLDYQTWEIHPRRAETVRVSFEYLADAVDRAVAWTAPDFAFFNGTNLFLYPVGRGFSWPATVSVRTEPGWRVTTGMTPAASANEFRETNYHDLVDMPFYVGRFALDSTRVADRWIRLAWYPASSMTDARRDRTFAQLQKFVPVEVGIFGEAPFRNYTIFQRSDTVVNGGGLEHQSSQVDEVLTSQLDAPWLPGLYSHEFFHAWNVKRLRPADLVPYRYDDAQPTPWLWVSEGLTDYYSAIALTRSSVYDSTGLYEAVANGIAYERAPPRVALGDASLEAWVAPTDGSAGLYYPKGALAGFLIDVLIRDATDNAHSLDDVMRSLYQTTYKKGRGFTRTDWWGTVSRVAGGKSFSEFARRYVDGREPYPADSILALAALRIVTDTLREPRLGVGTGNASADGVAVTQVSAGGAGDAAGLRPGDRIVSIGDVLISNDDAFATFRTRYNGTSAATLPLVVRRGSETLTLQLPVRIIPRTVVRVLPLESASAKAIRIRSSIVRR
jgi:predicted metalloprotease with PDZ domain